MKQKRRILLCLIFFILLNFLALSSRASDFYADHIFPLWVNTYGRLSGLFPFSLGEVLICIGLMLTGIALFGPLLLLGRERRQKYGSFYRIFYRAYAWILVIVLGIMTLNCNILYGCSPLKLKKEQTEFTGRKLITLRNFLVEQCGRLGEEMERDEEGNVLYPGDVQEDARIAMQNLADTFPRLKGFYPRAKKILGSGNMTQAYYEGVYFPFSMEANYNRYMYVMRYPSVLCHELAHLKGYIYEDEANFIAYLACTQSEKKEMVYSGYLSVLNYVNNAVYNNLGPEIYAGLPPINETIRHDLTFVEKKNWEKVEKKAILDTHTVDEVTSVLADTSLKMYGVEDGLLSYDRVTELLLTYYQGILYE